jgi:putative ABC transport system ATP-binding protein
MAERQIILQTVDLSRIVGDKRLVDDISMQVKKGDVIAITGPSGAGKSSFLRLLNRLDEPTGGTVLLEGQDYRTIPPQELRRRVGMVLQSPYLFPGSVADNIRFGPMQRGETPTLESIEQLLEQVNLSGFATRDVGNLSGGEAQRVSLARTLANMPQVLLLDEPTSSLDETTVADVEALICNIIRERKLSCLMVTHDAAQARRMASHVMLMEASRLVQFRPSEEDIPCSSNSSKTP